MGFTSSVYQGGTDSHRKDMEETLVMPIDPAVILYYLQALDPILTFVSTFVGVALQLLFLGLDFGSFFLGFI